MAWYIQISRMDVIQSLGKDPQRGIKGKALLNVHDPLTNFICIYCTKLVLRSYMFRLPIIAIIR